MAADRFATLLRSLAHAPTRRGALTTLLGGTLGLLGLAAIEETWAASRRCQPPCGACQQCKKGKCKKKHGKKRCKTGTCQLQANGTACGSGQVCQSGTCVTLQGTCATGADACVDVTSTCGGGTCFCLTTMEGQTRCGGSPLIGCNVCTTDAQCAAQFPNQLGVFCKRDTGPGCGCDGQCITACSV